VNTFALPDLRGRIPIHQGDGFTISQKAGTETVTLSLQQLPIHSHPAQGQAAAGTQSAASGGLWANFAGGDLYSASGAGVPMNSAGVANTGGSLPHDNLMPFLVLTFIISLFGIYPSQT
jgi:microcystin-dependent protein